MGVIDRGWIFRSEVFLLILGSIVFCWDFYLRFVKVCRHFTFNYLYHSINNFNVIIYTTIPDIFDIEIYKKYSDLEDNTKICGKQNISYDDDEHEISD